MVACVQARRVSYQDALKMMLALEDRLTRPFASTGREQPRRQIWGWGLRSPLAASRIIYVNIYKDASPLLIITLAGN